jgi:hypothetical protein
MPDHVERTARKIRDCSTTNSWSCTCGMSSSLRHRRVSTSPAAGPDRAATPLIRADLTNRCLYIVPACSALFVVGGLAVGLVPQPGVVGTLQGRDFEFEDNSIERFVTADDCARGSR